MANRFQANQYWFVYDFITSRDGEYCLICKKGPGKAKLQIDHADNNPSNWNPNNLHLLCQTHNLKFRGVPVKEKLSIIETHSANNVCVREKRYGSLGTKVVRDVLDYQSGSMEMKANSMFEPQFNEWVMANLPIVKKEAQYSGAHLLGCSPMTTLRYLEKLTSALGPLRVFKNDMGTEMIDLKPEYKNINDGNTFIDKPR